MDMHPEIIGNDRYALPPQLFFDGGKERYCSPWCNCGCTKRAYDAAVEAADALAARMGDGWEPHVWENMGWFYKVSKGVCEIYYPESIHIYYPHPDRYYTCIIRTAVQIVAHAETPEDALGFAVQDARGRERKIAADLDAL